MNSKEAYKIIQHNSFIKVGSKVKVTNIRHDGLGWDTIWLPSMNHMVNDIYTVLKMNDFGIRLSDPFDHRYYFPWHALSLLDEIDREFPNDVLSEAFLCLSEEYGHKISDRVKIIRMPKSFEYGWRDVHVPNPSLERHIGRYLSIVDYNPETGNFYFSREDTPESYGIPFFCLGD
jgi:hypothetical protein